MGTQSFGQFLVDEGLITEERHRIALHIQNKNRLLGEIAIEMGYLKRDDIPVITEYMERNRDIQFGEAAISLGLINSSQLRYLLDIRTRRKVPIGDILLKEKFLAEDALHEAVMRFDIKRKRLKRVLIAEESNTIAHMLERMLTRYGYEVTKVRTGSEALERARRSAPDILMTGGLLPDMSGIDLCTRVNAVAELAGVTLVLISSDDSAGSIERAFELGVNHFLKKPVTERELINVIYQVERELSSKRPERILVVDDSKGARQIITKELASVGFHVYSAEDGREAIRLARTLKPDIITMDLEMPVMGGLEACKLLKEYPDTHDIPVIIVSGSGGEKIRDRGFEAGAVEFFSKPYKTGRLAEYVCLLLETRKIRRREKIVVVEDSNTTRHILKYIFSKNGYSVYTAKNGEEALELLGKMTPDLIVTDCYMPGKDGFEFTRDVKQRGNAFRHVPVIMVTASESKEDVLRGLAAGASDYILKPFNESELIARAGAHIQTKKLFEEVYREKEALRISEENFRTITEAAHEGIVIHEDGRIVTVNKAFERIFGYDRSELMGMSLDKLAAPEQRSELVQQVKDRVEGSYEAVGITKDGARRNLEVHVKNIVYAGRSARVAAIWDITGRKQAEDELRRAKETAEKATNIKNQFVSLVAHDLRSPFTGILVLMHLLKTQEAGRLSPQQIKIIDSVVANGERMVQMIDELLDIGRLQTGDISPKHRFFDAHALVETVFSEYRRLADQKEITLQNGIPAAMALYADPFLYREVIGNLVSNAIKFCRNADTVTVFAPRGESGVIAVKDTGVGIAPDLLPGLFRSEIKTTTEGTAGEKGTGLGLVFASDIMKAHGGSVAARSTPGAGSEFRVTLPNVVPRALVVESDPAERERLAAALAPLNLETVPAHGVNDALVHLVKGGFHLVVAGLMGPHRGGFALLEALKVREELKEIPVVVVMPDANPEVRARALQLAAADVVTAPISPEEFISRITAILFK